MTLKLTYKFLDYLLNNEIINNEDYSRISDDINRINVNSNGFDLYDESTKIIAEVKSILPVYEYKYGAAQYKSIIKDVRSLIIGKSKVPIMNYENLSNHYRFLVLLVESDNIEHAFKCAINWHDNSPSEVKKSKGESIADHVKIIYKKDEIELKNINVILLKLSD